MIHLGQLQGCALRRKCCIAGAEEHAADAGTAYVLLSNGPSFSNGSTNGVQLSLHPIVDDGAVVYLNGHGSLPINMPDGP